VYSSSSAFLLV